MAANTLHKARELFDAVVEIGSQRRLPYLQERCDETKVRLYVAELLEHRDRTGMSQCEPVTDVLPCDVVYGAPLEAGAKIGDFEIIRLLGRGGAAAVYLARQESLNRWVALKVTRNVGGEAETMARLEHRHIVQAYSEAIDASGDARLICMQYVPGASLAAVLALLRTAPRSQLSGARLLAVLDELSGDQQALDVESLRDRQQLAASGYASTVCWLAARLAEALHFAHQRGVLHRDVKPGNILVNQYGRPLLTDFGLSRRSHPSELAADETCGGTVGYMSPEHEQAFESGEFESVDERSDIYSLGVVLYELVTLRRRLGKPIGAADLELRREFSDVSFALEQTIKRCLAEKPEERFDDAAALAAALDGCRALALAHERLPPMARVTKLIHRSPGSAILGVTALSFAPHMIGNVFLPTYNHLTLPEPPGQDFGWYTCVKIALRYGAFVFPAAIVIVARLHALPVLVWRNLAINRPTRGQDVDGARRHLLRAPMIAVALSALGWLPLLAYIPLSVTAIGVPLGVGEISHIVVSVFIALLIAATYSWYILQFAVVRFVYPMLWSDASAYLATARSDLEPIARRIRWFQFAAILVPLAGASLFLLLVDENGSAPVLRALLLCLILLGMTGVGASMHYGGKVSETVDALTRPEAPRAM